jgi:hypothetical protein
MMMSLASKSTSMKTSAGIKLLSAALLAAALAGCGEKSQDLTKGAAGSSVTRDTRAYEGEASKYALTTFKRGDKASWETHMKTRMQGQDEYSREK